jgi:glycosyltransferase involved in cell wall biosynthesis
MNRYILLTPALGNMGGAQMYAANKCIYLENHGWEVNVFYYQNFPIKIKSLEKHKSNLIPDFSYGFYFIPAKRRREILDQIKACVSKDDNVIVETHLLSLAYWGELVAKEVGGRHIINFLEEGVPAFNDRQLAFFEFKLRNWELMNAEEICLHRVFKKHFKEEYLQYEHRVDFMCTNVIDESDNTHYDFKTCDFSILSIGRLDKPYMVTMLEEIKKFVSEFSQLSFNLIFVGGSDSGEEEERIPTVFHEFGNVNVYMLGFTFPVPLSIIQSAGVGIASANSILVTADQGIPTIAVDIHDYKAIGVYGHTTRNKFLRTDEPLIPISSLLKDVLIEEMYPKREPSSASYSDAMDKEFEKELAFLKKSSCNEKIYFDVDAIYNKKKHLISHLKWYVHEKL